MVNTLHVHPKIVQGVGAFYQLMDLTSELQMNYLFVMMSNRSTEKMKAVTKMAESEKVKVTFFHKQSGEPTTDDVAHAVENFLDSKANGIVAIGGGSVLDLAKMTAVMVKNNRLQIGKLQQEKQIAKVPLIAIPTTAGTGSEVTKVSVITDSETKIKYNPGHEALIPDVAILDPELSVRLPKQITAQTGMDAFAHALEAFVSTKATMWTDMYALESIRLINKNLPIVYDEPNNLMAREKMLYASSLAGMAFSNASTNLAHATARALGSKLNVPHGLSVAIMLPPVIAFSRKAAIDRYRVVANLLDVQDVESYVHSLNKRFKLYEDAQKLIQLTLFEALIPELVVDALSGNGILTNRQVPTKEDIEKIFIKTINNIQEE